MISTSASVRSVNTITGLREISPPMAEFVQQRARVLETECAKLGIAPADAEIAMMWGGGKDSTFGLILACALSDITGCSIKAITMVHPGLSAETFNNISTLIERLSVNHQWRQFRAVLPNSDGVGDSWTRLYGALSFATAYHPRFMCVGCNFGSVVTEYSALNDNRSNFLITGNSRRELDIFDEWTRTLKEEFSPAITFPDLTGVAALDYYRTWWSVYHELVRELSNLQPVTGIQFSESEFLYDLPSTDDPVSGSKPFPVMEDPRKVIGSPSTFRDVLVEFGWRLPQDIQGGTETDCLMPAAIATIDISQNGLGTYLNHLSEAAEALNPFPEMYERAVHWAKTGRSSIEGSQLLTKLDLKAGLSAVTLNQTPVARALVEKLLPVR
jgi:hypothetical protein